jgi:hypothetical protein
MFDKLEINASPFLSIKDRRPFSSLTTATPSKNGVPPKKSLSIKGFTFLSTICQYLTLPSFFISVIT